MLYLIFFYYIYYPNQTGEIWKRQFSDYSLIILMYCVSNVYLSCMYRVYLRISSKLIAD